MELQFAKTAPGVMTASWTHPKKGRHYSIAIIESCDTQHLFIDGELIARELPTFEDAVTLARQKLESGRSSQLVRIASGLVLASVIGASIIVASKFMPAITASEIAAVTPAVTTPAEAGAKPLDAANDGAGKVASSAPLPASTVATKTVVIEPPPTPAPAPPPVAASGSDPAPASTGEPRRFSARYNLLALQAHADEQREAARKETEAKPEPAHALASDPAPEPLRQAGAEPDTRLRQAQTETRHLTPAEADALIARAIMAHEQRYP